MKVLAILLLVALAYGVTACNDLPTTPASTVSGSENLQQANSLAATTVATLPHMTPAWSKKMLAELKLQLPKLDKAKEDMKRFCPKYASLNSDQRVVAWGHLASAIILYESGVDSKGVFKTCSSMTERNGVQSIGFFQLSYKDDYCPTSKAGGDLCDPDVNIRCGVRILGARVSQDSRVASGGYALAGAPAPRGAARYWSVIRTPDPKAYKVNGKKVQRTHQLAEIIALTKKAPGCK